MNLLKQPTMAAQCDELRCSISFYGGRPMGEATPSASSSSSSAIHFTGCNGSRTSQHVEACNPKWTPSPVGSGRISASTCDELRCALSLYSGSSASLTTSQDTACTPNDAELHDQISVVVRMDCNFQQRHLRAAFAKRSQYRVLDSAGGQNVGLRVEEYEAIPWESVMGPPFFVTSSFCVRKGLGRKGNMAKALASHASRCGARCPLSTALPTTVTIDTTPVFISRPAWLDYRSALAECLFEAEDLINAGNASMCDKCWWCSGGSSSGSKGDGSSAGSPRQCEPSATVGNTVCACSRSQKYWILKPSLTNKGAEIHIVKDLRSVQEIVTEFYEIGHWVLQEYIDNPLLLKLTQGSGHDSSTAAAAQQPKARASGAGAMPSPSPLRSLVPSAPAAAAGHKFHIRVYVLAVGALSVFLYPQSLILIAAQPYSHQNVDSEANKTAHITNTCIGVEDASFVEATHVRALSELPSILLEGGNCTSAAEAETAVQDIYHDVCQITAHSFAAMESDVGSYMPLPRCWELYGVDFLVSEVDASAASATGAAAGGARHDVQQKERKYQVHLLEFNPSPDIKQTGNRLNYIIEGMVDGMVSLAVDQRISKSTAGAGAAAGADDHGLGFLVNTAPFSIPPSPAPGGIAAHNGVLSAPYRDQRSGWDCVYTKYWGPAHSQMNIRVS